MLPERPKKLISWMAPTEIHDAVARIARRIGGDRSISGYVQRLILQDLRQRGVVDEEGKVVDGALEQEFVAK